jgi:hypothetical protein
MLMREIKSTHSDESNEATRELINIVVEVHMILTF